MLTYRLINNLKENEDAQWHELIRLSLGTGVHSSRQKGFCLGREALRECLRARGFDVPIGELQLENYRSVKQVPTMTVSISHTPEWGAAIVGDTESYFSVGIDVEPFERVVKTAILQRISHPQDIKLEPIMTWSLKEACFKALMNSNKFDTPMEFSSIQLLDKTWMHFPSKTQGYWETSRQKDLCLAYAWIPAK